MISCFVKVLNNGGYKLHNILTVHNLPVSISTYGRTQEYRTLRVNEKQFELAGFELSGLVEYSICHFNNL